MKKVFYILTNLILLALCIYAIHDMQTSQGVGYYFALKFGKEKPVFDIVTDVIFTLFLFIIWTLPFIVIHSELKLSFSRLFILLVALIPTIRTDYVFDIFFIKNSLFVKFDFDTWISLVMNAFSVIVPMLILLVGLNKAVLNEKVSAKSRRILIVAAALFVFSPFIPGLSELLLFIAAFLLIVIVFNILETNKFDSLWLYGFLFAVAVYRIYSVTAAWS